MSRRPFSLRTPQRSTQDRAATRVRLVSAAVVLAWVGILFAAFVPGLMSSDSIDQYGQGLSQVYQNVHPPLVSWLNGIVARVAGSPWPLLLCQLVVLGISLRALTVGARGYMAWLAMAVLTVALATPPVWATAVTLWKDVLMAMALLVAVVLLSRRRGGFAMFFLILSSCFRHNALFAALPLIPPAVCAFDSVRVSRLRIAVACTAVAVAVAVAPSAAERLLHARDAWPASQLLVYDLAAIYVSHPNAFATSMFKDEVGVDELRAQYTPTSVIPLLFAASPGRHISFQSLPSHRKRLMTEWLTQVAAHPWAYATHRVETFRRLLGLREGVVCYQYHWQIDPNPYGLVERGITVLRDRLSRIRDESRETCLSRGWVWLMALAVVGAVGLAYARLAAWVALSGACYAAAYLIIGVSCEFRFLFWPIVAVFAGTLLIIANVEAVDGLPP